jgi:hypothetical protein
MDEDTKPLVPNIDDEDEDEEDNGEELEDGVPSDNINPSASPNNEDPDGM